MEGGIKRESVYVGEIEYLRGKRMIDSVMCVCVYGVCVCVLLCVDGSPVVPVLLFCQARKGECSGQ